MPTRRPWYEEREAKVLGGADETPTKQPEERRMQLTAPTGESYVCDLPLIDNSGSGSHADGQGADSTKVQGASCFLCSKIVHSNPR